MTQDEIKTMLDTLAEFYSQKDSIDAQKSSMLDEVKVPAEIQNAVKEGTRRLAAVHEEYQIISRNIDIEAGQELDEVQIPESVREILAQVDAKREEIQKHAAAKKQEAQNAIATRQEAIRAEIDAETKAIFDAVAKRRAEIETEFSGKLEAVNANIAKLEKQIKDATKEHGASVKGNFFHAVYVSGRVTWATEKLDGVLTGLVALCESIPALAGPVIEMKKSRKQGDPSITLRKI